MSLFVILYKIDKVDILKKLFLLSMLSLSLFAGIGGEFRYLSDTQVVAVYKGLLISPKCIEGSSTEYGVNTTCSVRTPTMRELHFNKERFDDFSKISGTFNSYVACKYQADGDMYYECKPLSKESFSALKVR